MDTQALQLLQWAASTERGIALKTDEPQRAIQKLQQTRREAKSSLFDDLVIAVSRTDPDGEVWIVRQSKTPEDNKPDQGPLQAGEFNGS